MLHRDFPVGIRSLDAVFRPRSIAVVGASDDPTRINGRPIAFAKRFGYEGAIYPINPTRKTVQGLTATPFKVTKRHVQP
ncbi:acetyl coenzyme A synthetase (ADP forming), alpha domain [compost metagenome]